LSSRGLWTWREMRACVVMARLSDEVTLEVGDASLEDGSCAIGVITAGDNGEVKRRLESFVKSDARYRSLCGGGDGNVSR